MLNPIKSKILYAALGLLCVINHNAVAQCIDTDGDGWGWDGSSSCQLEVTDSACVDSPPVGDGWGWNGVESCRVTTVDNSSFNTAQCIDPDGDGWGWNGVASCLVTANNPPVEAILCIDTDGDGYGWDGTQTCINDHVDSNSPIADEVTLGAPYRNLYQTTTAVSWGIALPSFTRTQAGIDAETDGWIFRQPEAPLGYPQGLYSVVVPCDDDATTVEDLSNPGMYFDAAKGQTCAKSGIFSIPAPDPIEFTKIGLEVFYENGNQWSCFEETRPSMSTEFEASGNNGSLDFDFSGEASARIGNNIYASLSSVYTRDANLTSHAFRSLRTDFSANVSYKDDNLTLYFSGLRRLQCERNIETNFPFTLYGQEKAAQYAAMWNAFIGERVPDTVVTTLSLPDTDFEQLRGDQIADLTMQCDELHARDDIGYNGFRSESETYIVSAVGNEEYNFAHIDDDGETTQNAIWTGLPDGQLERVTSGSVRRAFYKYTDDLYLLYSRWGGPRGSSTGSSVCVAACNIVDTQ